MRCKIGVSEQHVQATVVQREALSSFMAHSLQPGLRSHAATQEGDVVRSRSLLGS